MAVIRVKHNQNYTVMANYHLRDKRLSYKAKGIMSFMLSLPNDWDYSVRGLATCSKDGVDSVQAALKELRICGYLTIEKGRTDGGQYSKAVYTLTEKPCTENPYTVKPYTEKHAQINTNILSTNKTNDVVDKGNDELGACIRIFEDNIHPITGVIERDKILELYDKYHAKWIMEAVKVAAENHGTSIKYIESILKNWERNGFKAKKKQQHCSQQKTDWIDDPDEWKRKQAELEKRALAEIMADEEA